MPLQKERNQISKKSKTIRVIIYIAAAILYVVTLLLLDSLFKPFEMIVFLAAILFISLIIWMQITRSLYKKNRLEFKNKIVKKLFHYIDENLQYSPNSYIPETDYIESQLYIRELKEYEGKNLVRGRINSTDFCFSQINTSYQNPVEGGEPYFSLFDGLFFTGHLEEDLDTTTVLIPKRYPFFYIECPDKRNGVPIPSITMDSSEFNYYFKTYSWNPHRTKNILSPELIRKIIDFKKKKDRHFFLSLIGPKLFLAVKHGKQTFEPELPENIMSFACVRPYFEDFIFFMDLIDTVNSNKKNKA